MHLRSRRRSALALTAGLLAAVTSVSTVASYAAGPDRPGAEAEQRSDQGPEARGGFDARHGSGANARAAVLREAAEAAARPGTARLRGSLGDQALLDIDGTTGTPRLLTRLDGFLTPSSSQDAAAVTLGYVSRAPRRPRSDGPATSRPSTCGATTSTSAAPTTSRGPRRSAAIEVFGNGLQAAVDTKSGRLRQPRRLPGLGGGCRPQPRPPRLDTGDQRDQRGPHGPAARPAAPGRPRHRRARCSS